MIPLLIFVGHIQFKTFLNMKIARFLLKIRKLARKDVVFHAA